MTIGAASWPGAKPQIVPSLDTLDGFLSGDAMTRLLPGALLPTDDRSWEPVGEHAARFRIRDGELVLKWNLEDGKAMRGVPTTRVTALIRALQEEGRL